MDAMFRWSPERELLLLLADGSLSSAGADSPVSIDSSQSSVAIRVLISRRSVGTFGALNRDTTSPTTNASAVNLLSFPSLRTLAWGTINFLRDRTLSSAPKPLGIYPMSALKITTAKITASVNIRNESRRVTRLRCRRNINERTGELMNQNPILRRPFSLRCRSCVGHPGEAFLSLPPPNSRFPVFGDVGIDLSSSSCSTPWFPPSSLATLSS